MKAAAVSFCIEAGGAFPMLVEFSCFALQEELSTGYAAW